MDDSDIRNDALVAAMDAAARSDNAETRRSVYEALLAANVMIPIIAPPDGVEIGRDGPLDRDVAISVVTLQSSDGRIALPVFTDTESLQAWKPEGSPFVAMAFVDVLGMIAGQPPDAIVVNPAGPTGGELTRAEFTALREGRFPETSGRRALPAGTQVLIGAPSDEIAGPAMEEALREALGAHPAVFAGYLLLLATGEDGARLTVGIQLREPLEEPASHALFDDVARRLQPLLGGRSVDFVVLEGTMLEHARSIGPVYLA